MTIGFPQNFIWGTATAAYQVEGAIHEGGRTDSIWDVFCRKEGAIHDHSSGQIACDMYHRYPQDVGIMKELGVDAYRFSISWNRIIPQLGGPVNQEGVDYYHRLLDSLLQAEIRPVATLYHWDLPQYLQDRGGWINRDTALRFADYAQTLAQSLGDRVDTWTTLNEPWCSAYLGYGSGEHAPGIRDYAQTLSAAHHLNLAHGLAVQALRSVLGEKARVSVTLNLTASVAESAAPEDVAAKRCVDLLANEIWLGPMLDGSYDPELLEVTSDYSGWSFLKDGDEEIIHQPLDVLGVNYYSSSHVRGVTDPDEIASRKASHSSPMPAQEIVDSLPPKGPLTAMGWNQEPRCLTDLLLELSRRYPELDLMVTENGSAWDDQVSLDSQAPGGKIIHDPQRVAYLDAHVKALKKAIEGGAHLTGYFVWSLLDNFEWAYGYQKRFGIIGVNFSTQERIWKDSAYWYQRIIREGLDS